MDSLANYGSDGDNSNNSDDAKMPCSTGVEVAERRASDANYDPVQMDMSEESNNNNSSGDSASERASSPPTDRQPQGSRTTDTRRDSSRHRSSPDQRRSDHDSHSSNSREDHKRVERGRRSRETSKSRRSSHDERRQHRDADHSARDSRESKKSRGGCDDERKSSRDDDRRKDRTSSSSGKDDRSEDRDKSERDHHHRDDRRDRDRDRSDRDYRRDRDRRHSRDDRTKDRHRDEQQRSTREHNKDAKSRTRSRSRSKDRAPPQPFRAMSYREEKGRSKLAQLEKLGIELKAPGGEPVVPVILGEPNYYNPLATATQGKYAEQIQKRKLLWANKSKQDEGKAAVSAASTASTWMGTTFTHDQDGKVTAKFKRLMGIKGDLPVAPQPGNKPDILKKQEEMFNNMEQQYEVARATTHTQRGVGLGYASGGYQFPR